MKNKKQYLKAGGVISSFAIALVIAMLSLQSITQTVIHEAVVEPREWDLVPMGDIDPGGAASGVLNISVVKHGLYPYNANITRNASMFAWSGYGGEANNTEIGINVPFGVKFDIVAKVRWNKTHAFNTTSNNWTWAWVRGNLSMPRFLYENYTLGEWNITDSWTAAQDFVFVHYVLGGGAHDGDAGGAGAGGPDSSMSINRSERVPQCYFRFWSYY